MSFNDKSNPGFRSIDVHTLVQTDHVIALVDSTNLDQGWASYLQSTGVPAVGSGNSTTPFYANPDFYPEGQTQGRRALFGGRRRQIRRGTILRQHLLCRGRPGARRASRPLKQVAQELVMPFSVALEISASASVLRGGVHLGPAGPRDLIFVADAYPEVDKVAADCAKQGYHPIWVADGLDLAPSFATIPGGLYANVTNLPYFANTPANTDDECRLRQVLPRPAKQLTYREGHGLDVGFRSVVRGRSQGGGLGANGSAPTSAQLIKGLESLHGDTLDGTAPPLTFTAGQPHPVHCWFEALMKNGKSSLPIGTQTRCVRSKREQASARRRG